MRPIGLVFSSEDLEQMEANEISSRRASLQRWFEARDVFLGQNCKERDVATGLEMAREVVSHHEEAKWLVEEALADCRHPDDVRKALLRFPDDARALCFAGILGEDLLLIRRAADMGHPLAAAVVAGITGSARKKFLFASKAAEHSERLGLFHLAYCYEHGTGCEVDKEKALLLLKQSAEMNFVIAQWEYGVATKNYELMIKAAKSGYSAVAFLDHLDEPLREFDAGQNRERVYRIGKLLRHHVDAVEGTVFGTRVFGAQLQRAVRVVELYVQQETRVREAILAWRMVANRSRTLCKDMVEMVAEMVWEARFEVQYGAV